MGNLVPRPEYQSVIEKKLILKNKLNEKGKIVQNKVRLYSKRSINTEHT